jgi:hypothetical protein
MTSDEKDDIAVMVVEVLDDLKDQLVAYPSGTLVTTELLGKLIQATVQRIESGALVR